MSPSWRKHVRISLAPHRVALVSLARGVRGGIADRKVLAVEGKAGNGMTSVVGSGATSDAPFDDTAKDNGFNANGSSGIVVGADGSPKHEVNSNVSRSNWSGAIDALSEMLSHPDIDRRRFGGIDANVILSNQFVRYLVMPFSAQLVTAREEADFARMRFQQIFGEAANQWRMMVSPSPAGAARVCAAVDGQLIDTLVKVLAGTPFRLGSIRPALMSQFNAWRKHIGDNAWLVLTERDRVLIARIDRGEWRSVRSRSTGEAPVPLARWLAQERLLLDMPATASKVYLGMMDDVTVDTRGVQVKLLGPRERSGFSPNTDGQLRLEMAGVN